MSFPTQDVVATSVAIHRENGGFFRKHDDEVYAGKKKSNSQLLYRYFFENDKVEVTDADKSEATEIIEYLQGLGFKALERKLTDFESNVLKFVTSEEVGKESIGIAASLPKVYKNKLESDKWQDRERDLGKKSEYVGTLHERGNFDITVEFVKYIPKTMSYLVTANCKGNIIKFFAQDKILGSSELKEGTNYSITAYVKSQQVSKYSGFKETMVNRLKVVESIS